MKTCTLPFHLKTICFLLIKLYVFVVVVFALFFKKVQSYFLVLATHWENCLKWAKIMQTSARVGCSEPLQMPQLLLHLTLSQNIVALRSLRSPLKEIWAGTHVHPFSHLWKTNLGNIFWLQMTEELQLQNFYLGNVMLQQKMLQLGTWTEAE